MTKPLKIDVETGGRIKRARELLGLTQEEFGNRLGMTGNNVYLIESGRSDISLRKLRKIAQELKLPLRSLLPGDDQTVGVMTADRKVVDLIVMAAEAAQGEVIAFEISDDTMMPAYRPGDRVVGVKRDPQNCDGLDCIVEIEEKLMVRCVYPSPDGRVTLQAYNPAVSIRTVDGLPWAAPVFRTDKRPT